MAMESKVLSEALVAWSSGHLASIDQSYETTALEARSIALHALAKSVTSPADSISCHETNTAACLVLLTSEVCQGDRAGWYNHLLGAKHIIESAKHTGIAGSAILTGPEVFKQSPEGQWVLRNFAYHDVLGSVTLGRPPLISADYLEGITDVVDTYLGVASEVLTFISEASSLDHGALFAVNCSDEPVHLTTQQQFTTSLEAYLDVKKKLHAWRCDASAKPELAAVAYAYRSAALIHVYRRIRDLLRLSQNMNHIIHTEEYMEDMISSISAGLKYQANQILAHVSKIPLNDIPESALLFPLFMAGGEVDPTEATQLDMIRMRLRMILEKRHFINVLSALEVLEELWDRKREHSGQINNPETIVDWEDVLKAQGGLLLLT
jgi:transcriptional activator protein UGA3